MIDAERLERLAAALAVTVRERPFDQRDRAPIHGYRRSQQTEPSRPGSSESDRRETRGQAINSRTSNLGNLHSTRSGATGQVPSSGQAVVKKRNLMDDPFRFALWIITAMLIGSFAYNLIRIYFELSPP